MRDQLKQGNIPLYIITFPVSDQVNEKYLEVDRSWVLYPQSKIREIADGYSIPMLDLTQTIFQNGGTALFRDYLHLNPRGNDLVANQAEIFLAKELRLAP